MTREEAEAWNREPSTNGCLKTHPDLGVNIRNFAALVAVSLSDQTTEGSGNLGVLRGAHHEIERLFQHQRDAGGPLGPDGPNWERIDQDAPNGCGLRHYPDAVRAAYEKDAAKTRDGKRWPKPTLLRLAPGDAAIVLHAVPHSATRVAGGKPRLMAFFQDHAPCPPRTKPRRLPGRPLRHLARMAGHGRCRGRGTRPNAEHFVGAVQSRPRVRHRLSSDLNRRSWPRVATRAAPTTPSPFAPPGGPATGRVKPVPYGSPQPRPR